MVKKNIGANVSILSYRNKKKLNPLHEHDRHAKRHPVNAFFVL